MNNATIEFIKQWLAKANEDLFIVMRFIPYFNRDANDQKGGSPEISGTIENEL